MHFQTISKDTAEHYNWGECCDGWFLLKQEALHVIQERMPRGTAEVMHLHRRSRQLFYVLRGELTMSNPAKSVTIRAGEAVAIEPNIQHLASNESDDDVEFLVISCPPSHEDRFDCES